MARGTAVPTVSEKLTLLMGCTLSREIDWDTRVRCWSLILTEAFTFAEGDCAAFVEGDGAVLLGAEDCAALFVEGVCAVLLGEGVWGASFVEVDCCAEVLAVPLPGACAWPLAGAGLLVCAWAGWDGEDPPEVVVCA